MKDTKRVKFDKLLISVTALCLSVVLLVVMVFAWFYTSYESEVGLLLLQSEGNCVQISDDIRIIRTLSDNVTSIVSTLYYKRDTNMSFYEYDPVNDTWIYENDDNTTKRNSIRGLLPNESLDFIIPIERLVASRNITYNIKMEIRGEIFDYEYTDEGLTVTQTHSVLEVISSCMLQQVDGEWQPVDGSEAFLTTYGGEDVDEDGITEYCDDDGTQYEITLNGTGDDAYRQIDIGTFNIKEGNWLASDEDTMTIAFRLCFDPTQVAGLNMNNVLSLLKYEIVSIQITAS